MKKRILILCMVIILCAFAVYSGERFTRESGYMPISLNAYSVGKFLEMCQASRPEVVQEVRDSLARDGYYRKRTKDQRGKNVALTVYIDQAMVMHIITIRDEVCPDCNGKGFRQIPIDAITSRLEAGFRCIECDSTGTLKNKTTEKSFSLSGEDFNDPDQGRQVMMQRQYSAAPQGAQAWVERLSSQNPIDRLNACLWLDQNYVRTGIFFQDIMPMLKKARYHESNEKKHTMVWQFWAGKDIPNEKGREYYRIYADSKSGKITQKGFYSGR